MLDGPHQQLNAELICSRLSNVTDEQAAWVLLQEPGFIGFGVVQKDKICWPPSAQPDWTRVSDLRLFGEKGEWHVWPVWNGTWQSRLRTSENMTDVLTEYHVLWGTKVQPDTSPSPWVRLVEDRGTEIWLPLENLQDRDLPLRLKLKQVIDYEEDKSALAGIVDAALVGLVSRSPHDKVWTVWTPPSSLANPVL